MIVRPETAVADRRQTFTDGKHYGVLLLLCLMLAACSGGAGSGGYVGGRTAIECAPFARALTSVALSGAAANWWEKAAGHYRRSHQPQVGSILVFRRSGRLPSGHVAVVSKVVSPRQILVTQANWVHDRVTQDQPVIDVSGAGDWRSVRVWWPPSGQIGRTDYPTSGFILPQHLMAHDRLTAAIPGAIRSAETGW